MSRHIINRNVGDDLSLNIPDEKAQKIKSVTDLFLLSDETIHKIRAVLEEEMELGLKMNPERPSCLQMANTFIPKHLTGDEKGDFLALDLGGTNFRVILLTLDPASELQSIVKYYQVPEEVRLGEGVKLFEFLADCLNHFLEENKLFGRKLPLGFCFSFPMIQTSIDEGILVTWTKTFKTKNVVGHEVVKMLRNALKKYEKIDIDIVAIVNDATGTMMMGSYLDKRSAVGLILGTGCNASYFEKVERIKKWQGEHPGVEEVIIDIEWGAFGDNGVLDFMKTKFDKAVDDRSLLVNSFTFEKLLAGRYIGELTKQVLLTLIEMDVLFPETNLKSEEWSFTASDVSEILQDSYTLDQIQELMKNKGFTTASILDAEIVHYVCTIISVRGSLLVSICLATLLKRMDKDDVTIAVDGSLFKLHPKYKNYMDKFIAELAPKHKTKILPDKPDVGGLAAFSSFQLILAEDGSGKGAGLVAAVVTSLDNKSILHA